MKYASRSRGHCSSNRQIMCLSKSNHDMDELLRAAQDPELFEQYVLNKHRKKDENFDETNSSTSLNNNKCTTVDDSKKNGYVPIEEWDASRSKDDLSWEERVQYDGQRFGNRFQQNEILRKNLKSW